MNDKYPYKVVTDREAQLAICDLAFTDWARKFLGITRDDLKQMLAPAFFEADGYAEFEEIGIGGRTSCVAFPLNKVNGESYVAVLYRSIYEDVASGIGGSHGMIIYQTYSFEDDKLSAETGVYTWNERLDNSSQVDISLTDAAFLRGVKPKPYVTAKFGGDPFFFKVLKFAETL